MAETGFDRDFDRASDRATDAGTDAGTLAESDAPPHLILPDGNELGVAGLLALLEGGSEEPPPIETPPIETAAGADTGAGEAGATASSGGGSAYGKNLGGPSVVGLAALGTLDVATQSGVPNFPLAAVSRVQDDGSDVTLVFEDGGSLMLGGLGTGAIDSVNALLSEIGQSSVEVV